MKKKCKKCGEEKDLGEFSPHPKGIHGVQGKCKSCQNTDDRRKRLLKRPLPMYQTHKACSICGVCSPIESFCNGKGACYECRKKYREKNKEVLRKKKGEYYKQNSGVIKNRVKTWVENNKDYVREKQKKYRELNKEKKLEKDRAYAREHRQEAIRKTKEHNKSLAMFDTYGSKLLTEDYPTNNKGELLVKCKKCGKLFRPTNLQCKARIAAITSTNKGESHFYCSNNCKKSCDIYGSQKVPKSLRSKRETARSCQQTAKRALKANQCDEAGYNYCEKCGDIIPSDLHHTIPIMGIADNHTDHAGMMLLCPGCHTKLHSTC